MKEIAHIQNPREQGTTFAMLAEHEGIPDYDVQQDVRERWIGSLWQLGSPSAIVNLLRAFAAWDRALAVECASEVDIERVGHRMSLGGREDLQWLEAVVAALVELGRPEATSILNSVVVNERLPRALGLESTAHLLRALRVWAPETGMHLATVAKVFARAQALRGFVLRDSSTILGIGWLARELRAYQLTLDLGSTIPWVFTLPQDVPTTMWGTAWLQRQPWVESLLVSKGRGVNAVPSRHWACAAMAAVLSAEEALDGLASRDELISNALGASAYFVEAMCDDDRLHAMVTNIIQTSPALVARLNSQSMRLHPARHRLGGALNVT